MFLPAYQIVEPPKAGSKKLGKSLLLEAMSEGAESASNLRCNESTVEKLVVSLPSILDGPSRCFGPTPQTLYPK